jgi:hypothetical protein
MFKQPIPKQFLKEKEPWPKPIPSEATVISKVKHPALEHTCNLN